jgi:hypothetical protein
MGKLGFPEAWREIEHVACRVFTDALQDINQVGVGIHTMQPAGHQQALDQANALGAELCEAHWQFQSWRQRAR